MKLTVDIVKAGTGATAQVAAAWLPALQKACDKYDIDNRRRVAMFLGNIGVETGGLTTLVEGLNYSAARLAVVWPNRYAVDSKAIKKVPNALANKLAGKPQDIANNVYANRLGNGNEASGDGWKYRGQGPIQATGKSNITEILKAIGYPADTNPEVLQKPDAGALSAAYFWKSRGCNELADKDMFSQTVLKVNGALPCDANHGEKRRDYYKAALKVIDATYYK